MKTFCELLVILFALFVLFYFYARVYSVLILCIFKFVLPFSVTNHISCSNMPLHVVYLASL